MAIPPVTTQSSSSKHHALKRVASAGLSDSETTHQTPQMARTTTHSRTSTADPRKRRRKRRKVSVTKDPSTSPKALVVAPSSPGSSGSQKGKERELDDVSPTVELTAGSFNEAEGELAALREKVKQQTELLDQHKSLLDAIVPSLTCQICLDPMHRPYALAPCGHSACYACLLAWFRAPPAHITLPPPEHLLQNFDPEEPTLLARGAPMLLRKEKTCPHCRAVVREAPVEAWAVKDTVGHLYTHFDTIAKQLYPSHERPTDGPVVTGIGLEAWNGVFRGVTRPRALGAANAEPDAQGQNVDGDEDEGRRGFWDEEDEVYRCRDCMHEIYGGVCSSCGRLYAEHLHEDGDEWFTEDEVDGGLWMDHGPVGNWHGNAGMDNVIYDGSDVDDFHFGDVGLMGGPHRAREDDGYESSFIDDSDDGNQDGQVRNGNGEEYHSAEDDEEQDDEPRRTSARTRIRMPGGLDTGSEDEENEQVQGRPQAAFNNRRRILSLSDSEGEAGSVRSNADDAEGHDHPRLSTNGNDDEDDESEVAPHWSRTLVPRLRSRFGAMLSESDEASGSDHDSVRSHTPHLPSTYQSFVSDHGPLHPIRAHLTNSEDEHDYGYSRRNIRGSRSNDGRFFRWSGATELSDESESNGLQFYDGPYQHEYDTHSDAGSGSGGSHYGDAYSEDEGFA